MKIKEVKIMLNKNLLRGAIISSGYTQERLAKELKISNCTFTSRINGITFFNTDEIEKICKILNITEDKRKVDIFLSCKSQN